MQGELDPTHLGLCSTATSDSNTLQLAAEANTGLWRVNVSYSDFFNHAGSYHLSYRICVYSRNVIAIE